MTNYRIPRVIPNDEQIVSTTNPEEVYHRPVAVKGSTERRGEMKHSSLNRSKAEIRAREAKSLFKRVVAAGKQAPVVVVPHNNKRSGDNWKLQYFLDSLEEQNWEHRLMEGQIVVWPPKGDTSFVIVFLDEDQIVRA